PKAAAYVVRLRTENRARPASGKAQQHQKLQCPVNLMDWQSQRPKRVDSEPTSFPSADADLHCQGTPNPIGWKQSDNCYQRPVLIDLRASTTNGHERTLIHKRVPQLFVSIRVKKMEGALVDLAQALRERLAVIRDEQSRRDEAKHIARLRGISEKIETLQAAL